MRSPDTALPADLMMSYCDPDRDCQTGQMRASSGGGGVRDERIELPAVLAAEQARHLVEQALARRWRAGDRLRLSLPPSRMELRPGDAIQLEGSARAWVVQSVSIEDGDIGRGRNRACHRSCHAASGSGTVARSLIPTSRMAGPT